MLTLKKLLTLLKNYWYVPVGLIAALVAYVILRDKNAVTNWATTLRQTHKRHEEDVKTLNESHQRERAAVARATQRALEVQRQVIEEYAKNERDLDEKQKKRIEQITKKLKDDPRAMADEIEKMTGYRVLIVD